MRNENGNNLKELAESEGLYLINTHFKLRDTQIAIWHGGRPAKISLRRDFIIKSITFWCLREQ